MTKPNYYAVITADVRYDQTLIPNAKLLFAEITALCNMNGKCHASTKYFADLYNVSKVSIQKWLKQLEEKNYIKRKVVYKPNSKEIDVRYITIIDHSTKQKLPTSNKDKFTDNITTINNNITYNNIYNRKLKFEEIIFQITDISKDILQDFVDYWTEENKSGTKMKFELEKTFNHNLRLKRWCRNNENWNKNKITSKIDQQLNEYIKGKEYL
tara:strand:- start:7875 stop:8510 length:636 start_codon:yes stop_codon:yes gene_type:complete